MSPPRRRLAWLALGATAAALVVATLAGNADLAAAVLSLAFVGQVVQLSIPSVLAALGGAITERAGVVDLALEAKLLFGAFAAAAVAHATGSAYWGVAGGMAAGMLVAATQLAFALRLGADQVIIGVALNVLALGGTRFLLQMFYGEGSNSPRVASFGSSLWANPVLWIAVLASVAVPLALAHTRWGLRLRAAGDRPDALVAVGVSPDRARLAAALVGGALAGAGGAHLSLSVGGFVADMSSGRGYMALAMIILAAWRPAWAAASCVALVGLAGAAGYQLQMYGVAIPRELAQLFPYAVTLAVLVVAGNKRLPPRALGKL